MESAWYTPLALQFANVPDIDKHGVISADQFNGLLDRQGLDFPLGRLAQGLVTDGDCLRHSRSPCDDHAGRALRRTQADRLKPAAQAGTMHGAEIRDADASLALPDLAAFAWFAGAWIIYSIVIENTAKGRTSLNALMNAYRDEWMEQLLVRNMRMVDAQVTAALQNGTAFFASTSLIAIGGALTLLRSADEIMTVMSLLPLGATPSRGLWESEDDGTAHHLRLRVLQICLVLPAVQLLCHHGRRRAAAEGKRHAPPRRLSRIARRDSAPMPAAISTAANARSFLRSVISAGFSGRCRLRSPPPAS